MRPSGRFDPTACVFVQKRESKIAQAASPQSIIAEDFSHSGIEQLVLYRPRRPIVEAIPPRKTQRSAIHLLSEPLPCVIPRVRRLVERRETAAVTDLRALTGRSKRVDG